MMHYTQTKSRYEMPDTLGDDAAGNLAFFLLTNTGSIFGHWSGQGG